jgi:phenylalanine-4-hydroxylase
MSNEARRVEHQLTDKGYVPVYTTAVVAQPWARYTATDHAVWGQLFRRQRQILQGRACREFLSRRWTPWASAARRFRSSTR